MGDISELTLGEEGDLALRITVHDFEVCVNSYHPSLSDTMR